MIKREKIFQELHIMRIKIQMDHDTAFSGAKPISGCDHIKLPACK